MRGENIWSVFTWPVVLSSKDIYWVMVKFIIRLKNENEKVKEVTLY